MNKDKQNSKPVLRILMRDKRQVNRKKGCHYGQTKGFYANRTFGGNRHHCIVDGDIDAGTTAGKETGKVGYLPVESQTMGTCLGNVHRGKRQQIPRLYGLQLDAEAGGILL